MSCSKRVGSPNGDILIEWHHLASSIVHQDALLDQSLNVSARLLALISLSLRQDEVFLKFLNFQHIGLVLSWFFGMLLTLSLLISDPLVELVDSLHCFRTFGLTWHDVGLDLGLTSSPLGTNLKHIKTPAISCGNSSWAQEDFSHSRIHINYLVPLDRDFLVAFLDSIVNPFLEVLTDQSMNYIANVRALKFQSFFDVREGILDNFILAGKGENSFDR